jgi:hypothetical protein
VVAEDGSIGDFSDDSPRLKPGASGLTLVCRPPPRGQFHPVERALLTDSTMGGHRVDGILPQTLRRFPAGTSSWGPAETACRWKGAQELNPVYPDHCSPAGEGPCIPLPAGRGLLAQER